MRLEDLHILFPESGTYFEKKISPPDLYLSMLFFAHSEKDAYKPILQFINGISSSVLLDYSALENTENKNQKKIYESLFVFDIFTAVINKWILSVRYLKHSYEVSNSIHNLYEKISLMSPYINHFVISDISFINSAKLPDNAQQEVIKRVILIHKLLKNFQNKPNIESFSMIEVDYHRIASRYLMDQNHFNLVDRHIKCSPRHAFNIMNNSLTLFKGMPDFTAHVPYCFFHVSKFLLEISSLGHNKKMYLGLHKHFPEQPHSGYFINEVNPEERKEEFDYIHSPEKAPSFKLHNFNVDEFNLLPYLVLATAPNNSLSVFSAPILFLCEHNRQLSFYLQGLIDSYLPISKYKNPQDYYEILLENSPHTSMKVSKLQQLKKLTDYVSYEITLNINKLLFSQTPAEYHRNILNLHESCVSMESFFDCYALSSNEILECDFTDHESEMILHYHDTMIRFFAYTTRTSEDIYGGILDNVPLLSPKEMAYWKFIYICLIMDSDTEIPDNLAVISIEEFCEFIQTSYNRFLLYLVLNGESYDDLKRNLEETITVLIARFCQFYEKSGYFHSMFEISKQHLLLENLEHTSDNTSSLPLIKSPSTNSLDDKDNPPFDCLDVIFRKI